MSFEARGRLPGTLETLRLPLAVATVLIIGVLLVALSPDDERIRDLARESPIAASPELSPRPSSTPDAQRPRSVPALPYPWVALEPGRHELPFSTWGGPWAAEAWVRVTLPAGWAANSSGTLLERYPLGGPTLSLSVHDVGRVATDICDPTAPFVEVGPTVDELVAALSGMAGVSRSGPTDVTVDGRPAKRLALAISAVCPGPEQHWIWEDLGNRRFGIASNGGAASITIVDLGETRLVVAVHGRGASTLDAAEMRRIVDSLDIRTVCVAGGPGGAPCWAARGSAVAGRTTMMLELPATWEPGLKDGLYFSSNRVGPQGAEAIILLTPVPPGPPAEPCRAVLEPHVLAARASDLAGVVAAAPGTDRLAGPDPVTIGGHPAWHVALRVREDRGCDPGFLVTWSVTHGGAFWTDTQPGDTLEAWIVEGPDGPILVEAIIQSGLSSEVDEEIRLIVDSIEFG